MEAAILIEIDGARYDLEKISARQIARACGYGPKSLPVLIKAPIVGTVEIGKLHYASSPVATVNPWSFTSASASLNRLFAIVTGKE